MGEKKQKKWGKYLIAFLSVLLGAFAGFFGAMYIDYSGADFPIVQTLVCAAVAAYLQIIIHEGGHLIFGLLTGYRFVSFRIGSVIIYRRNGRLHLGKYSLAGTGGQCLLSPPDMTDGKIPCGLYHMGGALMNVITALLCIIIMLCNKHSGLLSSLCMMMAVMGFLLAVTNGIPMRMGTIDNDGYNALSLGKNPKALRSIWIQLKVNEQITEGVRLKDMPEEWFEIPDHEDMKNSMVATMGVFACNRLMDEKKFEQANVLMYDLLQKESGIVGLHQWLLTLDRIYCALVGEGNSSVVDKMHDKELQKIVKAMKDFSSVLRTQYAYARLFEKDDKKAESIRKRFEKVAKRYPYQGDIQSERELIEYVDEKESMNDKTA